MLESLTIFTPGGLVIYQYLAQPSLLQATDGESVTRGILNEKLIPIIETNAISKNYHIVNGITLVWRNDINYYIVALYPDILFEGPRQYLKTWAENLIQQTSIEFKLYYNNYMNDKNSWRPDPNGFDRTFRVLLQHSKTQKQTTTTTTTENINDNNDENKKDNEMTTTTKKKGGKEMRQWHDGNAKVTEESMAALDMNKNKDNEDPQIAYKRALQEARQTYMPSENDIEIELKEEQEESNENNNSWSSTLTGLFQQITGNKVLTKSDLEKPIQQMEQLLQEKNVANTIANELCQAVQKQLIGKKLNSMYRVQTAVQQALEQTLTKMLSQHTVDLLRNVLKKRNTLFTTKKPYVIAVMGINGIGKTTTLAKLAYYFQQNNCNPILVAGDTFRSGAVEQLKVHADCLNVPLFSQGYAKDPSSVAKAAIEQATTNGNDVVLIDTAGRMQNNVPLMNALGKLMRDNQPDFTILVVEALVGHDGLDQYKMFKSATTKIDGLILTKFDTIDTKMGACLTLTYETNCPIVFLGIGQKYHHLKKLNVQTVVKSLFS